MLADYPGLGAADVRVLLVHAGDRILPELSAGLGTYALERLRERGVEFKLGAGSSPARIRSGASRSRGQACCTP